LAISAEIKGGGKMSDVFGNIMRATDAGRQNRQNRMAQEQAMQQRQTLSGLLTSGNPDAARSYALQTGQPEIAEQIGAMEADKVKAANDRLNYFSQGIFAARQADEQYRPAVARLSLIRSGMSEQEADAAVAQVPSWDDGTLAALGMRVMSVKDQLDTRQMGTYQVNDDVMGWQTDQVTGDMKARSLGTAKPAYTDVTTRDDAVRMRAEAERSSRANEGLERRRLDLEQQRIEQGVNQSPRSGQRLVDGTNPNGQAVPLAFDPNTGSMQPVPMPDGYTYVPRRGEESFTSSLGLTLGGRSPSPQPAQQRRQEVARPTSKAEYDALPSGTRFIDPEGIERTKP
jgi:hypothetical protein